MLDWEVGCRGAKTLKRLWKGLKGWVVEVFCADHWRAYNKVLPAGRLVQSKAETYTAEQIWSDVRHWFKRFTRRSKVVSRSLDMLKLTLGLQFNRQSILTLLN